MRTDRELLELAAKAAAMSLWPGDAWRDRPQGIGLLLSDGRSIWNPLTDDGDAHRLAARLELDVMHRVVGGRRIEVLAAGGPLIKHFYEGNTAAAMRRAIVLAAAEIGAKQKGTTHG